MQERKAKERVLKNVRKALVNKTPETGATPSIDFDSDVFVNQRDEELPVLFAEEFNRNLGKFIYCPTQEEFAAQIDALIRQKGWSNILCYEKFLQEFFKEAEIPVITEPGDLKKLDAAITSCEHIVARLGAVVVSSKQAHSRMSSVFPPVHIIVAFPQQLVYGLKDALDKLRERYKGEYPSMMSIIAGPSRTADIEKTLVLGAHGPRELYLFFVDEQ